MLLSQSTNVAVNAYYIVCNPNLFSDPEPLMQRRKKLVFDCKFMLQICRYNLGFEPKNFLLNSNFKIYFEVPIYKTKTYIAKLTKFTL